MKILSIETSCDETAAAVIEAEGRLPAGRQGFNQPRFKILSNIVSSQIKIHRPFGGIVPTLAKRAHQENLVPVLKRALKEAGLLKSKIKNQKSKLQIKNKKVLEEILAREDILRPKTIKFLTEYKSPKIDLIAVTRGPGLAPALWPGINFARALAYFWQKPLIGVNHLEGHIAANWLSPVSGIKNAELRIKNFSFPAVCLIVSGGHTQLILMKNFGKYKLIGETRDDAAGECFDKAARILGLGYPGGPAIAAAAAKFNSEFRNSNFEIDSKLKIQNSKFVLPRPMMNAKNYDFSFSGLKTAVLYLVKEIEKSQKLTNKIRAAIAAECQQTIIDVLIAKTLRAAKNYRAKTLMLSGGVAANKELRKQMAETAKKELPDSLLLIPDSRFCTDNAVMIAAAAYFHARKNFSRWQNLKADANLRLA